MLADQLCGRSGTLSGLFLLGGGVGSLSGGLLGRLKGLQLGQLLRGVNTGEDILALVQRGVGGQGAEAGGAVPCLTLSGYVQLGKNLLAGGGHKRLQQHGADAQCLRQIVQHAGQTGLGFLALGQHPRCRGINILVGVVNDLEHIGQRILEGIGLHVGLIAGAQGGGLLDQGSILGAFGLLGRQLAAKVLVGHGGGAAQQVAEVVGQIHIDAVDQQLIGEVAVRTEREVAQQEVAQRIGTVALGQQVGVNHVALGLGHLTAVQQQPAMAVDMLGQGHIHAHQHGGPDDGVEADDLLADKMDIGRPEGLVITVGVLVIHEAQRRGVVEQRVDPDVDDMLGVEIDRDAPLETGAGNAEILKARVDEVVDHLVDAGARQQEVGVDEQVAHAVGILGQTEEVSLLLGVHNGAAAVRAAAVDKLALGPEALAGGAVFADILALVDVALLVHLLEDLLDGLDMVVIGRADEAVIADVHQLPQILDAFRALHDVINKLLRGDAGLLGLQLDLLAVLIGAGQELDIVALQALVAGHGIGCHSTVGVADMQLIAGVINRRSDVEFFLIHL